MIIPDPHHQGGRLNVPGMAVAAVGVADGQWHWDRQRKLLLHKAFHQLAPVVVRRQQDQACRVLFAGQMGGGACAQAPGNQDDLLRVHLRPGRRKLPGGLRHLVFACFPALAGAVAGARIVQRHEVIARQLVLGKHLGHGLRLAGGFLAVAAKVQDQPRLVRAIFHQPAVIAGASLTGNGDLLRLGQGFQFFLRLLVDANLRIDKGILPRPEARIGPHQGHQHHQQDQPADVLEKTHGPVGRMHGEQEDHRRGNGRVEVVLLQPDDAVSADPANSPAHPKGQGGADQNREQHAQEKALEGGPSFCHGHPLLLSGWKRPAARLRKTPPSPPGCPPHGFAPWQRRPCGSWPWCASAHSDRPAR